MKFLLDTHAALWWLHNRPELLGKRARQVLDDESTEVLVSAAAVWEASIKHAKGKLPEAAGFLDALERSDAVLLPVNARQADRAGRLPRLHGDPFDRLLVAHAQMDAMPLVSSDRELAAYGIEVIW